MYLNEFPHLKDLGTHPASDTADLAVVAYRLALVERHTAYPVRTLVRNQLDKPLGTRCGTDSAALTPW